VCTTILVVHGKAEEEQEHAETQMEMVEYGEPNTKRKRSVEVRMNRLHNIIENANNTYGIRYLRAVAHNFAL
jgi:hypothetical protein